ncbi:MAG: hypothetical protein LBC97_12390 [Bifidobacteriaceae bacterium]|nr:hypothetical protein [Bifidobacteriaceae bacterium]
MFLITRNPLWAAMPLAAVVASVIPLALRGRRARWWESVAGLDPQATAGPGPSLGDGPLELVGDPAAVEAFARRLIASGLGPGTGLPSLAVPPAPRWAWTRFAPAAPPGHAAFTITPIEEGLRLSPAGSWEPANGPWPTAAGSGLGQTSSGRTLWRPSPEGDAAGLAPPARRNGNAGGPGTSSLAGLAAGAPGGANGSGRPGAAAGAARWMVKAAGLGLLIARAPGREPLRVVGLGAAAMEDLIRRRAADSGPPPGADPLPLVPDELAANWRAGGGLPAIALAAGGGAVRIDLASDGPHALVAGTSGSGKSEFLRALMLAECVATPPDRLIIVGLDHKGGATFRDLEHLPHVVGVATDLDAAGTSRVLTSLEAELAGRERLLERHGRASWGELPPAVRPARLLVVVDEFRTLLDALPQAAGRLERLAAQGRSLGMGLVLATQRPAGAVSAQLRANLALRVCFRVATEADSLDVLGSAAAAALDPDKPGSCILASAGRAPAKLRVRLMPPPGRRPAMPVSWPGRWFPPPAPPPNPAALVAAIAGAATAVGARPPDAPWRPPLPERLTAQDSGWPGDGIGGVVLGLADQPDRQAQRCLTWDPASGHLAILGPPRSGRTTAAVTAAAGLAAASWMTHVVTHNPAAFAGLATLPAFGSVIPPDAPERLGELLQGLAGRRIALVMDAYAELEDLAVPALGRSLIDALIHGALAPGAALVVTAPAKPARWLGLCPHRLVLPVAELTDALALGLPRDLAAGPRVPGRVCHLGGEAPLMAQLCLPPTVSALSRAGRAHAAPGDRAAVAGDGWAPPRSLSNCDDPDAVLEPPHKVVPLPTRVNSADLPAETAEPSHAGALWVGLGGALGTPLALPIREGQPVGVIGPPGSGRSTALAAIRRRLEASGHRVLMFPSGPGRRWPQIIDSLRAAQVVLVDDLESVSGAPPPAPPAGGTLIATCTTATAAAFRPPSQWFHANPLGIVLWPSARGSAQAFGPSVNLSPALTGPCAAEPPGRARLVIGSKTWPVQLAT